MEFTKTHEWARQVGDLYQVGVTNWAQKELGDIVFIELPKVGTRLKKDDVLCVIETTKAAADITCPFDGTVREVNALLAEKPGLINSSAENLGWIAALDGSPEGLLSAEEYLNWTT